MATSVPTFPAATDESEITSARPKGKWATPEKWMAMKPTIRKMYMEDNVPLKDVMNVMETQHDFHATVKMYKSKLNEWGFFKTFKPREVLDALRTLEARKSSGGEQHPTLTMRGVEIDIPWIRDYIKRNRKRINKITRSQNQHQQQQANFGGLPSSSSNQLAVSTTLAPTGTIRLAEELLTTMNIYVDNAMSCGLWYIDSTGFYRSSKGNTGTYFLYDFWDRLDEASQAMSKSQRIDLVDLLNPAFARLNDIVREEDPRSLPFLLGCFEVLRLRGRSDLVETFLKYIWQLSSTLLGSNYLHSRIWRHAYLMFRTGSQEQLIEQVFVLLMDRYHRQGSQQMMVAQTLGGGGNPYVIKCRSGLHQAYKMCLRSLELTIKQQLEQLEADENAHLRSRSRVGDGSGTGLSPEQQIRATAEAISARTIAGPLLPNADEIRHQIAQLRADHTAGILGILRSAGQFREAQEALEVLAPITTTADRGPDPPAVPPSSSSSSSSSCSERRSLSPSSQSSFPSSQDSTAQQPESQPQKSSSSSSQRSRRQKPPDKVALLVSLVDSKRQQGNPSSAENLTRLVEHLVDNPSVYRDEGWINWIFEGLVNVPRLAAITDSAAARQRLRDNRAFRLSRERERASSTPPPATADVEGETNKQCKLLRDAVERYLQRSPGNRHNFFMSNTASSTAGDDNNSNANPSGNSSLPPIGSPSPRNPIPECLDTSPSPPPPSPSSEEAAAADRAMKHPEPEEQVIVTEDVDAYAVPPPELETMHVEGTRETSVPLDKVYAMENTCRGGWRHYARAR